MASDRKGESSAIIRGSFQQAACGIRALTCSVRWAAAWLEQLRVAECLAEHEKGAVVENVNPRLPDDRRYTTRITWPCRREGPGVQRRQNVVSREGQIRAEMPIRQRVKVWYRYIHWRRRIQSGWQPRPRALGNPRKNTAWKKPD